MAQTNFTPISLYYSATSTNVPTAGNLVAGELAINTADGKLFYKDSAGVVQVIGTKGGVGSSTTTQVLYNSSGLVVGSANMTFSGTALTLANDASISGLTVGKGAGSIATNTILGGNSAFGLNTTGNQSTIIGYAAGFSNTTGSNNSVLGYAALISNTTGGSNTALGNNALGSNTTASNNTAVGYQAGYSNTTGEQNVYFGSGAAATNSTGSRNTIIGYGAGSVCTSNDNVIIGRSAGAGLTTGGDNTFIGARGTGGGAGYAITTGSKNTIIGQYTGNNGGLDIRTASNYIVLSDGDGNPRGIFNPTGYFKQTPTSTLAFGGVNANEFNSNANTSTLIVTNQAASGTIGGLSAYFNAQTPNNTSSYFLECVDTTNTKLMIYSTGTVSNRTGTYNSLSDAKLKENIVDATPKLDKLMGVRVRNYNLIGDDLKQIGFVAQELETVFPSLIDNVPDLDENKQPTGEVTKGVKLTVMIPILVKAIQELKAEVDSLKQQLGK